MAAKKPLVLGSDGRPQRLQSGDSVAAADVSGLAAVATSGSAADLSAGTLAVARGGTGQTSYTDGQILIGNSTGNTLAKGTISAPGTALQVTNGGGSISLAVIGNLAAVDGLAGTGYARRTGTGTWDTVAAATQVDQEAATSTTTPVTPGRQQYHPSAAKAWVTFSVSGGVVTVRSSYNVSSVSRTSAGLFVAYFSTAFSAQANVCPVASAGLSGSRLWTDLAAYSAVGTGSVTVVTANAAGTLTDPDVCAVVAFGDQ